MSERSPRALDEVLGYLGNLGFDHLYTKTETGGGAEAGGSAEAGSGHSAAAHSNRDVGRRPVGGQPAVSEPQIMAPGRQPTVGSEPAHGSEATPHRRPDLDRLEGAGIPLRSLEAEERFAAFDRQRALASSCTACGLCRGRKSVVFGDGHPNADLMFIGEGPGAEEDRKGLPFVGPAGALLTRIIEAIDFRREQVYIANMVKCRPPGNRDPSAEEIAACRPFLEAQIDLVRPKVIVCLGKVAAQALLGSTASLGAMRGRWHTVRGVATLATYHPAALLRNEKWKRPTWEDMKVVRARLAEEAGRTS